MNIGEDLNTGLLPYLEGETKYHYLTYVWYKMYLETSDEIYASKLEQLHNWWKWEYVKQIMIELVHQKACRPDRLFEFIQLLYFCLFCLGWVDFYIKEMAHYK